MPARFHHDAVADDAHPTVKRADLDAVAEHPAALGEELGELAEGVLRAREGERFEAFARQPDEDDLGRDERLANEDGGERGDGERQVGADAALEEASSEP